MRYLCLLAVCLVGLVAWTGSPVLGDDTAAADFFNGKDFDGWEGLMEYWSVKDGAIVGDTSPDGVKFNTFLCSKRKYTDFELQFQVRLRGQGWNGNSGVQIRSKIRDAQKDKDRGVSRAAAMAIRSIQGLKKK